MAKLLDPGKQAEKDVEDWLKAASSASFQVAYHRFPDARAARGALAAQPSDFLLWYYGTAFFLEVKETKQVSRLPLAKVSQYGKLKQFHLAGALVRVIIYMSELKKWTVLRNFHLFEELDGTPTSFDLKPLPKFDTLDECMREAL